MNLNQMLTYIYNNENKIKYLIFSIIKNNNPIVIDIIFDDVIKLIIENHKTYDEKKSQFNTWFYTILKYKIFQYLKQKSLKEKYLEYIPNLNYLNNNHYNLVTTMEIKEKENITKILYKETINIINNIKNKKMKIVLQERFINNKKYEDISKEQNINCNTVKTIIRNGKNKIKKELEKKYPEYIELIYDNI